MLINHLVCRQYKKCVRTEGVGVWLNAHPNLLVSEQLRTVQGEGVGQTSWKKMHMYFIDGSLFTCFFHWITWRTRALTHFWGAGDPARWWGRAGQLAAGRAPPAPAAPRPARCLAAPPTHDCKQRYLLSATSIWQCNIWLTKCTYCTAISEILDIQIVST